MAYTFPASDLDNPDKLLNLLGSFWANTYQGNFPVETLAYARAQLDAQVHLNLLELVASMSRFHVPVFHRENWYFIQLTASQLNETDLNLAKFDGTYTFDDDMLHFDVPNIVKGYSWVVPTQLRGATVILNRITGASLTLLAGIDFFLDYDAINNQTTITFRENPFNNELVSVANLVEGNAVIDQQAGLWLYRGEFELETIYNQFGYVLGMYMASSQSYKELVNAVFTGLVDGGTARSTDSALAAMTGVKLAVGGETVQSIQRDARFQWVITDKNAYPCHLSATVLVGVGDALTPNMLLSDTLQIYEFNTGELPTDLQALSMGPGFLANGFISDLVFSNTTVPLVVEENVDGYTKVSFALGGLSGDVASFWNQVHARGVAANQTLAMLLDQRPTGSRDTQPTALALPATVNPLGFLIANVLRNNIYVARVKPTTFGPTALGLYNAHILRKIMPAHTAMILLVEFSATEPPVILDGPGDDTKPGVTEQQATFSGTNTGETFEPASYVSESVRARQTRSSCQ